MLVKNLLQQSWPVLKLTDTVKTAVQLMHEYGTTQLPVVSEEVFVGYFGKEFLETIENPKLKLDNFEPENLDVFIYDYEHVILTFTKFTVHKYTILACVNTDGQYTGCVSQQSVIDYLSNTLSNGPLGIISLEVDLRSYTLSEIARLVEQNDCKILFSYFSENKDLEQESEFVMVLNTTKLLHITSTFERYNYKINYAYSNSHEKSVEMERLDALFKYLEV